jgi:hypothetical protein
MLVKEIRSLLFSDFDTIVFHCTTCGMETKREVKPDKSPRF